MPIQEFETQFSLGYNGTDLYSSEDQYGETAMPKLKNYLDQINLILDRAGQPGYANTVVIRNTDDQLRALVDLCHVYGISVLFDVVYNHAGGDF